MQEIQAIIREREKIDKDLFFLPIEKITSDSPYTIIKRNKRLGIIKDDMVIVSPIYDNVRLLVNNYAILEIENAVACYDLVTQLFVTTFEYHHILCVNNYLKVYKDSNLCGIFDLVEKKQIVRCGLYEDFNLKDRNTKYMWAKYDKYFHFINKHTGKIIRLQGISMAYDTPFLMMGKDERDTVSVYNEEGRQDLLLLRRIVQKEGGYMTLYNYTYNIQHLIDINGNVLNI